MNLYLQDFSKGILKENPIFRQLLGCCPTLAVTTLAVNGLGMGLAATAVLVCSNVVISSLRRFIPERIRIPCYIVVIATFVTVIDMLLKAFQPGLYNALGVFVPLIVVNCIILGRAEAFAGKRPVIRSLFDGLGMGLGFTLALLIISTIREIAGQGSFFGIQLFGAAFEPMQLFAAPSGAFIVMGLLLALTNIIYKRFSIE
ncbi:MAG: electron transport complex subunit E [Firmicutes bacterium]|nr:electron transport complex subunit E [Bacillota bacterium]